MRAWPRVLTLTLGLAPVLMLAFMAATIAYRSTDAITEVGLGKLTGTEFSTIYSSGIGFYGLRPAAVGTLTITIIAMVIALPMAVAMAILVAEFPLRFVGRLLELTLGVLSGIPPIVYALMAVVFVGPFMRPKFTGGLNYSTPDTEAIGVARADWPAEGVPWNAGAFPWDATGRNNSALLAGILLALLVIPFITPLIIDALRNVPREPKEASLALGTTRWHTLRRITLPGALPGIIAATGLGTPRRACHGLSSTRSSAPDL
jgi:phosphate transport system permease protein